MTGKSSAFRHSRKCEERRARRDALGSSVARYRHPAPDGYSWDNSRVRWPRPSRHEHPRRRNHCAQGQPRAQQANPGLLGAGLHLADFVHSLERLARAEPTHWPNEAVGLIVKRHVIKPVTALDIQALQGRNRNGASLSAAGWIEGKALRVCGQPERHPGMSPLGPGGGHRFDVVAENPALIGIARQRAKLCRSRGTGRVQQGFFAGAACGLNRSGQALIRVCAASTPGCWLDRTTQMFLAVPGSLSRRSAISIMV